MMQVLGIGVNQVLTGQLEPKEALDSIQEQFKVILLRYGLWDGKS
jgi:ABC-type glycerol-3-phosphate transport system substrate-binding protein